MRVLHLLPTDSQRSGALTCATRIPAGRRRPQLAHQSTVLHRGRAPRERGFLLVRCPFVRHGPITISAAWGACMASARVAPPPHREPQQWRACVRHANPDARLRLQLTRRSAVVHRGREPFRRCSILTYGIDRLQSARHSACVRRKRSCCASSPQTANAVARLRAPRESQLLVGGHCWHVGARSCTEREMLVAGSVTFRMAWTDYY